MYKLIDPFDGKTLGFSELKIEDEAVLRTWTDDSGQRQFETRFALCEETTEEILSVNLSAEQWLEQQGFTSVRLVALLDLESKLAASGRSSPKLASVRAWINSGLSGFVADASPRSDWPPAPFDFQETTAEAFAMLTTD
jgi:hypothetical protein